MKLFGSASLMNYGQEMQFHVENMFTSTDYLWAPHLPTMVKMSWQNWTATQCKHAWLLCKLFCIELKCQEDSLLIKELPAYCQLASGQFERSLRFSYPLEHTPLQSTGTVSDQVWICAICAVPGLMTLQQIHFNQIFMDLLVIYG